MNGEICRCFDAEESTKVFAVMGTIYTAGFFVCSALNAVFSSVHVEGCSGWTIDYTNVSGVYLAGSYFILQCLGACILSDLSRLFDQKQNPADVIFQANIGNYSLKILNRNNGDPTDLQQCIDPRSNEIEHSHDGVKHFYSSISIIKELLTTPNSSGFMGYGYGYDPTKEERWKQQL